MVSRSLSFEHLFDLLPNLYKPAIIWYGVGERIELSGHVVNMWSSKVAALLDSEIGTPSLTVHMALPPHWRSIVWAAGIWRAGNVLTLDSDQEAELSLACNEENLDPGAEVSVLTPLASLALRWPGTLPPLTLDGTADLMSYPDSFAPIAYPPSAPAWLSNGELESRQQILDRAGLYAQTLADINDSQKPQEITALTASSPNQAIINPEQTNRTSHSLHPSSKATRPNSKESYANEITPLAISTSDTSQALLATLGAWLNGRTALLLDPQLPADQMQRALAQEGCTSLNA
jgi:putative uncharacterized protein (fragment)